MPNVQPIQQPPIEDLRNALQIAALQIAALWTDTDWEAGKAMSDVARLLTHAIDGLGEPSFACVQATAILLREARHEQPGVADEPGYARDTAAAILRAAITGEIPRTWSEP